jgi:cell division protease FtsH
MKDKMDFNPFNDQNDQKNRNESPQRMPNMNGRGFWKILIVIIIAAFLIPALWSMFAGPTNRPTISYTQFRQELEKGNITQVVFSGQEVQGTFKSATKVPLPNGTDTTSVGFVTYMPPVNDSQLLPMLEKYGVEITTKPPQNFSILSVILNVVPFIIFIWIGYIIFQNMRSQRQNIFQVGQSRAKLYKRDDKRTTFTDVAGLRGAKEEVKEIIDYLKDPTKYHKLGATTPRGILLVGPPGTGKTLLARAIAGEADVPFYSISGSDFMEMFVGVGASRVRSLFQEAKKHAPALIFIDELDSVGRHRGAGLGGGHDEREQTLNQMLSEMDGY